MKNVVTGILLAMVVLKTEGQCISGNCLTGSGTYNYGWCIYTGDFKNGKPEGKGSMKYDDYTYTGLFVNGLEDGQGVILKKDGSRENVNYKAGKKITSALARVDAKDYKPVDVQNVNCVDGNCNTGFGTYQFSSGNKYTGNFVDHKFEGKGAFIFANGDKFEGSFHNNEKASGTYKYFTGATYAGTYDSKGMEYNGTITSPQGLKVPFVNGKPIIPPRPKPAITQGAGLGGDDSKKANGPREPLKVMCSVCFGSGAQRHVEDWSSPTTTHLVSVASSCWKCFGKGYELIR